MNHVSVLYYTCHTCKWERWVTGDRKKRDTILTHPILGDVKLIDIAAYDKAAHNCVLHRRAKQRAAETREWAKRQKQGNGQTGTDENDEIEIWPPKQIP